MCPLTLSLLLPCTSGEPSNDLASLPLAQPVFCVLPLELDTTYHREHGNWPGKWHVFTCPRSRTRTPPTSQLSRSVSFFHSPTLPASLLPLSHLQAQLSQALLTHSHASSACSANRPHCNTLTRHTRAPGLSFTTTDTTVSSAQQLQQQRQHPVSPLTVDDSDQLEQDERQVEDLLLLPHPRTLSYLYQSLQIPSPS